MAERDGMEESEIIELAVYGQRVEAEFAREILSENDIESFIKAEAIEGVIYSFPGNYAVYVSEEDFEKAKALIDSLIGPTDENDSPEEED
jgi:hypothetical protein